MNVLELARKYVAVMYAWNQHTARLASLHARYESYKSVVDEDHECVKGAHTRCRMFMGRLEKSMNKAKYKLRTLKPLKKLIEDELADFGAGVRESEVEAMWPKWMNRDGRVRVR